MYGFEKSIRQQESQGGQIQRLKVIDLQIYLKLVKVCFKLNKMSQNLIQIGLKSIIIPSKCELHSTCFLSCSKFYILGFDIWASFPSSGKVHVLCHFLKQILESLAAVLNSDDFPFFKPSLSLLEAELAPFKDWLVTVNPLKYEPVKSSASLNVWSHEGSNLYPKMAQ